jgi:hypothetical protein
VEVTAIAKPIYNFKDVSKDQSSRKRRSHFAGEKK